MHIGLETVDDALRVSLTLIHLYEANINSVQRMFESQQAGEVLGFICSFVVVSSHVKVPENTKWNNLPEDRINE